MSTTAEIAGRLEAVPSATVYDVLDARGHGENCVLSTDLKPLVRGRTLAGPVHTIRWVRDPRKPEEMDRRNPDAPPISPLFRGMEAGSVLVVDASGDRSTGHWGEMLSMMARHYGARGAIIDGGVRDTPAVAKLDGWSMHYRYTSPIESISRVRIREIGVPVALDGASGIVRIRPGDWVYADDDAVIAIPGDDIEAIAAECEALEKLEIAARDALAAGEDPDEVFRRYRRG